METTERLTLISVGPLGEDGGLMWNYLLPDGMGSITIVEINGRRRVELNGYDATQLMLSREKAAKAARQSVPS